MRSTVPVVLTLVTLAVASAIPKPNDGEPHKGRVVDRDLTDEDHFGKDEDHNHNAEFDHEMFVGKDEAKSFDQLTPEESQERLGKIYHKIDRDEDGKVTENELTEWIKLVQNRYIWTDTERQWKEHDAEDEKISWDSYRKRTYGMSEEEAEGKDEDNQEYNYKEMLERDRRRWKAADTDGDNALTKKEFSHFLHPEDYEHMRDIVVDETLDDIDKDKDGFISIDEYIGDMWPNQDGEEEPDWVKTEREQFHSFRDTNKDGRLDREEVKAWIIPPDYDHSEAEAKHLIYESDGDKDGVLTKEEVVSKYDLFVGSQATDFGEALTRHDEF